MTAPFAVAHHDLEDAAMHADPRRHSAGRVESLVLRMCEVEHDVRAKIGVGPLRRGTADLLPALGPVDVACERSKKTRQGLVARPWVGTR